MTRLLLALLAGLLLGLSPASAQEESSDDPRVTLTLRKGGIKLWTLVDLWANATDRYTLIKPGFADRWIQLSPGEHVLDRTHLRSLLAQQGAVMLELGEGNFVVPKGEASAPFALPRVVRASSPLPPTGPIALQIPVHHARLPTLVRYQYTRAPGTTFVTRGHVVVSGTVGPCADARSVLRSLDIPLPPLLVSAYRLPRAQKPLVAAAIQRDAKALALALEDVEAKQLFEARGPARALHVEHEVRDVGIELQLGSGSRLNQDTQGEYLSLHLQFGETKVTFSKPLPRDTPLHSFFAPLPNTKDVVLILLRPLQR